MTHNDNELLKTIKNIVSKMHRPLDGLDRNQSGFANAVGWNAALRQVADYLNGLALTSPEPAQQDELPPLPNPSITSYQKDSVMRTMELHTYSGSQMIDYALQARASVQQETASKGIQHEYELVPIKPRPDCCDEGKGGSEECCGNGACDYLADVRRAGKSWGALTRLSAAQTCKPDVVTVDAVAWEAFIKDYDDYNEGTPNVTFHDLRESLAIVIESAEQVQEKKHD